jgi:hypothetical protein
MRGERRTRARVKGAVGTPVVEVQDGVDNIVDKEKACPKKIGRP